MRAEESPLVEGAIESGVREPAAPERQRPLRTGIVLRLDGSEPADDVGRVAKRLARQPLACEPCQGDDIRSWAGLPRHDVMGHLFAKCED
jgi:hypothetical protein